MQSFRLGLAWHIGDRNQPAHQGSVNLRQNMPFQRMKSWFRLPPIVLQAFGFCLALAFQFTAILGQLWQFWQ
jgi:hypothetical protein